MKTGLWASPAHLTPRRHPNPISPLGFWSGDSVVSKGPARRLGLGSSEGKAAPWPPLVRLALGRGRIVRWKRGFGPRPPISHPEAISTLSRHWGSGRRLWSLWCRCGLGLGSSEGKAAPWPPPVRLALGRGLMMRWKRGFGPRPPISNPNAIPTLSGHWGSGLATICGLCGAGAG